MSVKTTLRRDRLHFNCAVCSGRGKCSKRSDSSRSDKRLTPQNEQLLHLTPAFRLQLWWNLGALVFVERVIDGEQLRLPAMTTTARTKKTILGGVSYSKYTPHTLVS